MDPGTLSVTIISAKELPKSTNISFVIKIYDSKGKSVKKIARQTSVLKKTGEEPAWNETYSLYLFLSFLHVVRSGMLAYVLSRVEKGYQGFSVALRSRDESKGIENLLGVSRGDEKLGKARISDSHLREQGGQIDGWYQLVAKSANKARSVSPSKRNTPPGQVHLRVTFEPDPLAADKAREKLLKHFPELAKDELLVESFKCSYKESALKYQSGTLFLTDKHGYFYARGFKLRITYADILAVRKAHSALVIPNAIEIDTRDGRQHHLTNFVFRDQAFALLETRLPSLSYLQPPESTGRSPSRTISGAIDARSMYDEERPPRIFDVPTNRKHICSPQLIRSPSNSANTPQAIPSRISGGAVAAVATSPPLLSHSPRSSSTTSLVSRSRAQQLNNAAAATPGASPSPAPPASGSPTPDPSPAQLLLPRSVGTGELSRARKSRHMRTKSDGEAMNAELRFRAEVGQHLPPSVIAAATAAASPHPGESAEQRRLRERLSSSLVEEESRRRMEESMKAEVQQNLKEAAEERRGTPVISSTGSNSGTSTPLANSASPRDLQNRKLREELLKQEEMRKLLWDQTLKEKTNLTDSLRLSTQMPPPDLSPMRTARRIGVLFVLLTLSSLLFSSSFKCASWSDRIEAVALLSMLYVLVTPLLGQLATMLCTKLTSTLQTSCKLDAKQAGFAGHASVLLLELLLCRAATTTVSIIVPGFLVGGIKALVLCAILLRFLSFCADQVDDFVIAPRLG